MSGTIWQDNALRFATRPEQAIDAIANIACRETAALFAAGRPDAAKARMEAAGRSIGRIAGERRAS